MMSSANSLVDSRLSSSGFGIDYWNETLTDLIEKLDLIFENPVQISRKDVYDSARLDIENGQCGVRSFRNEINKIPDNATKKSELAKLNHYSDKFSTFKTSLDLLSHNVDTEANLRGSFRSGKSVRNRQPSKPNTTKPIQESLDDIRHIQNDTVESLRRSERLLDSSLVSSQMTLEDISRQREQVIDISSSVKDIDFKISKASDLLKQLARRFMSDRIIQCLTCINVILVIIILVYVGTTGKTLGDNQHNHPPNPSKSSNSLPRFPIDIQPLEHHPVQLIDEHIDYRFDYSRENKLEFEEKRLKQAEIIHLIQQSNK